MSEIDDAFHARIGRNHPNAGTQFWEFDMIDEDPPEGPKKKPDLRILAENSAPKVNAGREYYAVEMWLRPLTANIIRVVRGAGRPEEIVPMAIDLARACLAYQEKCGYLPPVTRIEIPLGIRREREENSDNIERIWRHVILERTIRASLQIAACRVSGHDVLERKALRDFWDELDRYHVICTERDERWREKQREQQREKRTTARLAK